MGRLVGYARVSTRDQETRLQLDALARAGVSAVYEEKASGVSERPMLRECLAALQAGDVFVFWRLDRVARRLGDLVAIEEDLRARGIAIRSLTEPFDTTTAVGVCMFQTLGAFAQLERATILERSIAGQVAAIRRGVVWGGRAPALDASQRAEALALRAAGLSQVQVAARFGVSRSTISRLEVPPKPRVFTRMPVLGRYLQESAE
ncbi:recombinase family protein [Paracidovorax konjaci]|uniref:recombinase family protein n=1 Tax=Paracidovorax konjaci TaxID=32040 RepID=UPI000B85A9B2|nr:recombinase family protein [Paracidovorax konjaci]